MAGGPSIAAGGTYRRTSALRAWPRYRRGRGRARRGRADCRPGSLADAEGYEAGGRDAAAIRGVACRGGSGGCG
ncbi:hypothetical protein [Paenibacillus castaneae]|uniref:hypothetical protein n=1 Tax=Paenibacillus castaneae TaxID=474957 RepID=UPI001ABB8FEE|nr:hypothetical protein [Paenibacillus castaneae]